MPRKKSLIGKKQIMVTMPDQLYDALQRWCESKGFTPTQEVTRNAIQLALMCKHIEHTRDGEEIRKEEEMLAEMRDKAMHKAAIFFNANKGDFDPILRTEFDPNRDKREHPKRQYQDLKKETRKRDREK